MAKNPKKFYVVVSKSSNFKYGAFDGDEEGLRRAEKHVKKLEKQFNQKFVIK